MSLLFFDTETTGKADFKAAPDANHQPRLVQLAALLTDDTGEELASLNCIIRATQFEIPKESSDIHGITTEKSKESGVPLFFALQLFSSMAKLCSIYVCHNIEFDFIIMQGESLRMVTDFPIRNYFCTMKAMTPVCKLPGNYGFKWPKLQEAFKHCFNREFDGAHDALADVRACRDIYFWLKNNPQMPTP